MSLNLSSILVALCLGVGFVSPPLPVWSLPVNAIEIAQSTSKPSTAEDFYNRGVEKGENGDLKGAIADFNQAIRINPNYADAYGNRGSAYGQLEEFQKAIADFNQAIRLNPRDANFYYNRGATYARLEDRQKAIADYSEAIHLNPNDAGAYLSRGAGYVLLGESQKAIADLQKAANLFQQQGNIAKAQQVLDALKEITQSTSTPTTAEGFSNRGAEKGEKEDFQGAIADFNEAIRLNPNYEKAYSNRGAAYFQLGDIQKAIADFN
jgi:tetratricopeptide (TPR) repeat protein